MWRGNRLRGLLPAGGFGLERCDLRNGMYSFFIPEGKDFFKIAQAEFADILLHAPYRKRNRIRLKALFNAARHQPAFRCSRFAPDNAHGCEHRVQQRFFRFHARQVVLRLLVRINAHVRPQRGFALDVAARDRAAVTLKVGKQLDDHLGRKPR